MDQLGECCQISREQNEPLYGTCGRFDFWVMVGWPRAKWHPEAVLQSEGMPLELADFLGTQLTKGRRVAFRAFDDVTASGDGNGTVTVKIFPAAVTKVMLVRDMIRELGNFFDGRRDGWQKNDDREFYICTDSGHDQCCGKYGEEIFQLVEKNIFEKKLALKIFRCSHLGGHKYAPTGIVFPAGHMYGRIGKVRGSADQLDDFLRTVVAGEVYPLLYRGTVGLSVDEQIAMYAMAKRGLLTQNTGRVIVDTVVKNESEKELVVHVAGQAIRIPLESRFVAVPDSCKKMSNTQQKIRWFVREDK